MKCFGNFEVYVKNETLVFKRLKTKELFAFLVDRNGAGVTAKQICAVLFPDDTDDTKNSAYLRQLVMDLKNTLKAIRAEDVFRHHKLVLQFGGELARVHQHVADLLGTS